MVKINGIEFHHTVAEWATLDMDAVKVMSPAEKMSIIEQLKQDIQATEQLHNSRNPLPESMGK